MFHPTATIRPRAAASRVRAAAQPTRRVTRKDFTDRLGLPSDASEAQILAAIPARRSNGAVGASSSSNDDALYARLWGGAASGSLAPAEDAIYSKVFG